MSVLTKKAGASLDYAIDWLDDLNGDTITTSSWAVTGGCVVDSDTNTTTLATVVISGGEKGATVEAVNIITTAGNKTHVGVVTVRIL